MLTILTRKGSLLISLLFIVSCTGSTRLIESWYDNTYAEGAQLQKVLVLGVFRDDTQRRVFESRFSDELIAAGGQAIAGYTLMPETAKYDDKEDITAAVAKANADAVLITSFKGASEETRYVQPTVSYAPSFGYGRYGAYYGATYQTVYNPGYTVVDKVVSLDTRVYSVEPEKLIWAGKTKSINAASNDSIATELVKIVMDDMRANGLIN